MIPKFLNKSIFRFFSVGIISEILYLSSFMLLTSINVKSNFSVLISGSLCIFLTSFLHAKVTFRTKYNIKFLTKYTLIQLICMILSYLLSLQLIRFNMSDAHIGFITMAFWAFVSYLLCRSTYTKDPLI